MKVTKNDKVTGSINMKLESQELDFIERCMRVYCAMYICSREDDELRMDIARISRC